MKKALKFVLVAILIGIISVIYNYFVFLIFKFYPDASLYFSYFGEYSLYILIFIKNFLVGLILIILFSLAYSNIRKDKTTGKNLFKGIFFFILYAIFALLAFSVGDLVLLKSNEGMLVLLTIDSVVESLIATIPVKFFTRED